jgi:putative tryptophan/tyrosine transport system substrate-binding protein
MPVVGFLGGGSPDTSAYLVAAFQRGLGEGGFVEGGNVIIEYRWAHGQFNRLPALGAELTQQRLSVFVASGSLTSALVNVVSGVPMVAMFAADPAKAGLVASLNRPGGNLTGANMFAFALGAKRCTANGRSANRGASKQPAFHQRD